MTLRCDVLRTVEKLGQPAAFARPVAILIPAYNEARHLRRLLARCRAVKPALIVVVDDASTDDTAAVLAREADDVVYALRNERNLGKQGSVRRGLGWIAARAAVEELLAVALIDGDGQHDPAELPRLAALLERDAGYDLVIGARAQDEMPLQRRLSNGLVNLGFALLGGIDFADVQSGLRIYRKAVADVLAAELPSEGGYGLEHESLTVLARHAQRRRLELRAVAAPVSCAYRGAVSRMQLETYLQLAAATVRHARRIRRANRSPGAVHCHGERR